MPEYPFRKPDGTITHRAMPMSQAVPIGDTLTIDGEPCVRVASDCLINGDPLSGRYPHESPTISAKDARARGMKFSKRGVPIFENRNQERSYASERGLAFD